MDQAQRTVKVLLIQGSELSGLSPSELLGESADVVTVHTVNAAKRVLQGGGFDYVMASPASLSQLETVEPSGAGATVSEQLARGIAVVGRDGALMSANPTFRNLPIEVRAFVCATCDEAFIRTSARDAGDPLQRVAGQRVSTTTPDGYVFDVVVTALIGADQCVTGVVAIVFDVTGERKRQAHLAAIDHAGRDLVRLDTERISHLGTGERLALLDRKITRYLRDLMHFDHFSIHILDKKTNKLELVVCSGLPETIERIDLFALPQGNGITGRVAHTGRAYVCADVSRDEFYLQGLEGARSSLTVPLRLNDEVIGVLNVESDERDAFDEDDRQLAEMFGRDIAVVLHILDLLVIERYTTTGELGSDVMAEITAPVNDILTDVENLIEDYIGHDDLRHRLNKITGNAVAIREAIKQVTTQQRGLTGHHPTGVRRSDPILTGKRLLIADDEAMIRETVHDVLVSYGCNVSVANNGDQAIAMIGEHETYDLVLSDIKMPGRNGYDVFAAAKDADKNTPVILMTGFGYDPNHSIVRARREGLSAVLFKPFKVDQLLGELRSALRTPAQ